MYSVGTVSGFTTTPLHFSQPPGEAHGKLCVCFISRVTYLSFSVV
jgi:hypothetical protein